MGVTVRVSTALGSLLLALCPRAFALNPALDVSQYAHASWKYREGFTKGSISQIVQTADGYLWLGTGFGLYRFDGIRAVPWQPPPDQPLPSNDIMRLLAARDGTLWIGTRNGLANWKNGKLAQCGEMAGLQIAALIEDREGSIWVGSAGVPEGKLCEIQKGAVRCDRQVGGPGHGVFALHEDAKGNLWVGLEEGLWRWKPGPPEFYSIRQSSGIQAMTNGEDGELLISTPSGLQRLVDRKGNLAYPLPAKMRTYAASRILRDRDGGLWGAVYTAGILHWHQGRMDVFSELDGLSGNVVRGLFEDREGNIWAASDNGLDRFRDLPVVNYSRRQSLSSAPATAVIVAKDESVWFGSRDGFNRMSHGQLTVYSDRRSPVAAGVSETVVKGLPNTSLAALTQDSHGRIWLSSRTAVGYLENDRFVSTAAPGGIVTAIAEGSGGAIWVAYQGLGLLRLSERNVVEKIPWDRFGHQDLGDTLFPDPLKGGLWVGFFNGGIAWFRDGQVRRSYSAKDGLGTGRVSDLRIDREGALWAATEGGLSRLKDGRMTTLSSKNGLPCDAVQWSIEDDVQSAWLMTACGLVRVARTELNAWAAGGNNATWKIHPTAFDSSDGVNTEAIAGAQTPHVAKSPDGKLWFHNVDGVGVVDPRHLLFNKLPPPVHIEQITADRKTYDTGSNPNPRLPPLVRDLVIDYTALSLAAPEKIQFKYKLEGHDRDWEEVGNRRQAFYNDLPPRHYRFRVAAANNSGVWNEAGASLDFEVAAAYYQTIWFQALCVLWAAALLWLLYRLRLRQMSARVNLLYQERLAERTRIARDLHDTLLQSLAGVSLQLDGISKQAATAPEKTPSLIARVREQVDSAFREARTKVWNLRSTSLEAQGLEGALRQLVERMGPTMTARCSVTVTGQPRPCSPDIEEELLHIAQEAANNANRHAQANEIRIALDYGAGSLTLSISDDGKGFDFEEGLRKTGHWGLKNMQERAAQIRGTCKIATATGQGTQIEIRVPLSTWSLKNALRRNRLAKHAHSSSGSR
jgi:signal transduction histidine kinase/ligand-binding sensor domain-containing protein